MSNTELLTAATARFAELLSHPEGVVAVISALLAGALIIASTIVKTIIPLRWLAVGSNVGFVIYGALGQAWMVLALHAVLLPVNLVRAWQMHRLTRRVRASAEAADLSGVWLRPYMKQRKLKAGSVLFRAGDLADRLYFLVEGQVEIVEGGYQIKPGQIFGEIAFFAPDRMRTGTARCVRASTVMSMDETTFKQLYFQNPEFGFEVVRMIAGRLSNDVRRLQQRLQPDVDEPKAPA
ncbi:Crp/Fnr family transcriptional regulator [Paucibacter sp. KCTC 42545]|uniref:Crp/Fnr family transcriptional regulator n=1 Tax=Paucibacter sp. KCTC 42545 TaxID=1768242 RepID=UPI000733C3D7|nr:cyclic nucleotide-binding domain-containing protein [Paucibacter sp. KCTC 42545]ALT77131.1 hypothetical protein AT984_07915 [Paucibacter sp. KCTC 42545]